MQIIYYVKFAKQNSNKLIKPRKSFIMLNRTRPIEPRIIYDIETSRHNGNEQIKPCKSFTIFIQYTIGKDQ